MSGPAVGPRRLLASTLLLAPLLIARPAASQQGEACACTDLLNALAEKVETNHPAYHLEVRPRPAEAGYRRHLSEMHRRAATATPGLNCLEVLQTYVGWFEDGHVFVGGRPPIRTAADSVRLRQRAPRLDRTEEDVIGYFDRAAATLDPLEGLWVDPVGLKIGVVRDDSAEAGRFVAVVLASAVETWSPGDVKATFEALPDGSYDVVLYDDARAPTRPHVYTRGSAGGARLQREGLLLHMPPTSWGRLHPVRPGQEGLVDPLVPRAPTARMVGSHTVVFHIPSHLPSHAPRLEAMVEQHRGALRRARTLIIDLRGNEGGSAGTTNALLPYLGDLEEKPARYLAEGASAVLAAADNIAYFERTGWAPPGLVERLRTAEPGTLVPFVDPDPDQDPEAEPEETEASPDPGTDPVPDGARDVGGPRNVAILMDRGTVSAAEAFVLRAMRSGRVTLFGEATGSSIDYQTVGVVRFGCPDAGLYVGYPTIVGSDRLPEGGVRPTGIVPDVPLHVDDDPIGRIIEYYRGRM